mgnify:CR=1 FL=1
MLEIIFLIAESKMNKMSAGESNIMPFHALQAQVSCRVHQMNSEKIWIISEAVYTLLNQT